MREIKFRAWYKPLSIMIESGALESINFETKVVGAYIEFDDRGYHKLRLSDFELMQNTDRKDKNGIEVYEGDVIRFREEENATIAWHDGGFALNWHDSYCHSKFTEDWCSEITVIGNKYEHPHLLKEAQHVAL